LCMSSGRKWIPRNNLPKGDFSVSFFEMALLKSSLLWYIEIDGNERDVER